VSRTRCFGDADERMAAYHDQEWGVPVHDEHRLFEHIVLQSFQAGLSWRTILHKRDQFREAFAGFDPAAVAAFTLKDVERLMLDAGIVRNRRKIEAAIANANVFLAVQSAWGNFDAYLWAFTAGKTLHGAGAEAWSEIPTQSDESRAMAKDMKQRGFRFVGPTICYAMMQAIGMVNDHLNWCFRRSELLR